MSNKLRDVVELAAQTVNDVTVNPVKYMDFLTTASRIYKYSYKNQLLIYAQKPDAVACLNIKNWNQLGRWVNRGTKGVAIFKEGSFDRKLDYVFDLADTNSRVGKEVTLWNLKNTKEENVKTQLAASFGYGNTQFDLPDYLLNTVSHLEENRRSSFYFDRGSTKSGSTFEKLSEEVQDQHLSELIKNSVGYMLLSRCGYDTDLYFTAESFRYITEFDTLEIAVSLSETISNFSSFMLREVETAVKNENRFQTIIAKEEEPVYDKGKTIERSVDHGSNLQPPRRLSDSRPDSERVPDVREVRNSAPSLPDDLQTGDIYRSFADRETGTASSEHRGRSEPNEGNSSIANDDRTERNGRSENQKSDAVAAENEQHPSSSRGDRNDGVDLQLSEPLPTEEEQTE